MSLSWLLYLGDKIVQIYKLFPLIFLLLQSCIISGGIGLHATQMDSDFVETPYVGWFQGEEPLTDHVSIYMRHESQLFYQDKGSGINSIGTMIEFDFNK